LQQLTGDILVEDVAEGLPKMGQQIHPRGVAAIPVLRLDN